MLFYVTFISLKFSASNDLLCVSTGMLNYAHALMLQISCNNSLKIYLSHFKVVCGAYSVWCMWCVVRLIASPAIITCPTFPQSDSVSHSVTLWVWYSTV